MTLRDYQRDAWQAILDAPHAKKLVVMPTGSGKSHVIAECADHFKRHVVTLIVSPRVELVRQTASKLTSSTPCHTINYANRHFKDSDIDVLLIDEAHLVQRGRGMYSDLMARAKLIVGFTATPYRLDVGHIVPSIFDKVVYEVSREELVHYDYLVTRKYPTIPSNLLINVTKGALTDAKLLSRQVCPYTERVIEYVKRNVDLTQRTLIFSTDLSHAEEIKKHIDAPIVSSKTPKSIREKLVGEFLTGKIKIIINCELFTTGFDCPPLLNIIIMRPTASYTLYEQIVGRGDRPFKNKKSSLIYDFTVNSFNFLSNSLLSRLTRNQQCDNIMQPSALDAEQWVCFCTACGTRNDKRTSRCMSCDKLLVEGRIADKTCPSCRNMTYKRVTHCHLCQAYIRWDTVGLLVSSVRVEPSAIIFNNKIKVGVADTTKIDEENLKTITKIYYKRDYMSNKIKLMRVENEQ